jgi:hypothetical protein
VGLLKPILAALNTKRAVEPRRDRLYCFTHSVRLNLRKEFLYKLVSKSFSGAGNIPVRFG